MKYKFLRPYITDETIHEKRDGVEFIREKQVEVIYEVITALTPLHGYKGKQKQAIKVLENLLITMYWRREEISLEEFVKDWRSNKLTEIRQ